jgi:hypothetical protein
MQIVGWINIKIIIYKYKVMMRKENIERERHTWLGNTVSFSFAFELQITQLGNP